MDNIPPALVTGLILAGGRGQRLGGLDKGLLAVAGRPVIEHLLERLGPQVADIIINANRNHEVYTRYGHPVVADSLPGYQGPLAGVLAGLERASTPWVLTVPCDSPDLPLDLRSRLAAALTTADVELAVARDPERLQPLHALIPTRLAPNLRAYLEGGGRQVRSWLGGLPAQTVNFARPFANINADTDR